MLVSRFTILAALILIASACTPKSSATAAPDAATPDTKAAGPAAVAKVGAAAPNFALKDGEGKIVKLSDYKGKVVLLNFWATWCGPCKIEVPWFVEFEKKYKGQGFAVLGVSMDDDGWAGIKAFMAEEKINYRVLLYTEQVSDLYGGIESLPTTFVIDRQGRLSAKHEGLVGKDEYAKDIETLLTAKPVGAGRSAAGRAAAIKRVRADQ